jgi:hypothetical protein
MFRHAVKIRVVVQQGKPVFDPKGGDDHINGFADDDPLFPQRAEIGRCLKRDIPARKITVFQRIKQLPGFVKIPVFPKALEQFDHDKIANNHPVMPKFIIQKIGMGCGYSAKVVNPNRSIHHYHTSARIFSRSPSH